MGEGLSEGEMKRILLSKLAPETKTKIRDNQADKKVNRHWVEVHGLPKQTSRYLYGATWLLLEPRQAGPKMGPPSPLGAKNWPFSELLVDHVGCQNKWF